ncbi:MAG: hypothetical protein ABSH41_03170 [Syntrophobacteraceae bacterium]
MRLKTKKIWAVISFFAVYGIGLPLQDYVSGWVAFPVGVLLAFIALFFLISVQQEEQRIDTKKPLQDYFDYLSGRPR